MAKQITFTYKDKEYILEYNRETVQAAGVPVSEINALEAEPLKALDIVPAIWEHAFDMHHPSCPKETRQEIYEAIKGKDADLQEALFTIYLNPLETLFDKSGNVTWKKNWK